MHFRFRIPFSLYYKKEPEILADIPHRIDPKKNIPIVLLIKDSDKYQIQLKYVRVTITQNKNIIYQNKTELNIKLSQHWWFRTLLVPRKNMNGHIEICVEFNYTIDGKTRTCTNHNLKLLSPSPLKVYLSEDSYPSCKDVQWCDLHYHSNYTEDMVEFGAPLESVIDISKSMGIHSVGCTDHSYDLDDAPDSWIETDPDLHKWTKFQTEVDRINKNNESTFIIPGEELSLHNSKNRNVHLLVLNNKSFLLGQGDSAERPFNFYSEHNVDSVEDHLDRNTLCIAAHPCAPIPLAQRLLVKRGKWNTDDLCKSYVSGMQILNGSLDEGFNRGKHKWISLLLDGCKKFIYAGNDAHGNFNKFRQIETPMLSLKEKDEQIFAECRTGYYPEIPQNVNSAIKTLKAGNCFITNGPYINIHFTKDEQTYTMGSKVYANNGTIEIEAKSNVEFGKITKVSLYQGIIGQKSELLIFVENIGSLDYQKKINLSISENSYFRAEIESFNYRGQRIALTNPIWIDSIK